MDNFVLTLLCSYILIVSITFHIDVLPAASTLFINKAKLLESVTRKSYFRKRDGLFDSLERLGQVLKVRSSAVLPNTGSPLSTRVASTPPSLNDNNIPLIIDLIHAIDNDRTRTRSTQPTTNCRLDQDNL